MNEAQWCQNSRRWIVFMDMNGYPKSCPRIGYEGAQTCAEERCGYFQIRPPSRYYLRTLKILGMNDD